MVGRDHVIAGTALGSMGASVVRIVVTKTTLPVIVWAHEAMAPWYVDQGITFTGMLLIVPFVLGCLFADTDLPNSTLGRYIHIPVEHRTWTHTAWVLAGLSALSLAVAGMGLKGIAYVILTFSYGYMTHIVLDCWSKGGVALFYPITGYWGGGGDAKVVRKSPHLWCYSSGSLNVSEIVTTAALVALALVLWNLSLGHAAWALPWSFASSLASFWPVG